MQKMKKLCDAAVERTGIGERVVFTGFVSDEELDILLRGADVFVYPSLYEGFGIPILEAMKVSTPVVASNVTAMPEVAGDSAVLVDPESVDDIAAGMARMMANTDEKEQLVAKGKARAEQYSWARNCDEYLAIYERVAGR